MTERLLQFIWQFQYFNKGELQTTTGESLQIIFPGNFNSNQGPDFLDAKIKTNTTTWAGNIELHINTSDWKKHNHHRDKNYNNVILHVVWENDLPETSISVFELNDRVAKSLLQKYEEWMNAKGFIPCENTINGVKDLVMQNWKERLLAERLMRKADLFQKFLEQTNYHWEECFWWLLARNFGIKINADAFEAMAKSISINILAKHKNQIHQLESLLMGQAGLLEKDFNEDYPKLLQREYNFLKKKYGLNPINMPVHFLRMRPGNFPTIRLAQLAMLIHNSNHLFSKIIETTTLKELRRWLDSTANDYWHYHYLFDEAGDYKIKKLGNAMINTILINTICPVLFAYGHFHNDQKYKDKALQWLEETAAEKNTITKKFQQLGLQNENARDSQALIELKNEYCSKKRCLDCAVGNALLKS
jgi:Protein of unknown function (DUF2851)